MAFLGPQFALALRFSNLRLVSARFEAMAGRAKSFKVCVIIRTSEREGQYMVSVKSEDERSCAPSAMATLPIVEGDPAFFRHR